MQEELHELKISTTARGIAIRKARGFVNASRTDESHALEEAFAGFEPPKDLRPPTPQNTSAATTELANQLKQLEEQRQRLQSLLDSLEQAD